VSVGVLCCTIATEEDLHSVVEMFGEKKKLVSIRLVQSIVSE